eukprot:TRINITY_DN35535_c0_g1_i1.p1 TRINITY_DN35535_c0_g1~~TRINITY_DN35535_c0_g1_i1.p1  ORF type:complete len:554 (+),score=62.85 TRINITY_DN35535_c0_g1_i1:195-1856(+)
MENARRMRTSPCRPTRIPRPCTTGKRVQAGKRPAPDERKSCFQKLMRRELSHSANASFKKSCSEEKFRNFSLTEEYDTFDAKATHAGILPCARKRAKIVEISAAGDMIFALAHSGACAAISRNSNRRICYLNTCHDEIIRSLFYNKNNDSLITVSVYSTDGYSHLKCRTTPLEYIRRGQPDAGFRLFETESLKWPGFVEFDDVNGKVLTYSAQNRTYKVFDLKNYNHLYSISDKSISEIKISPGMMLLIHERTPSHVPLKMVSIEDGQVLRIFNHMLRRTKKVDFIEQFNENLLVKQEHENLQILDMRTCSLREVSRTEFMTPTAFIFLYENRLFLTFRNRTVSVWNFRGEMVTSFEDHVLWYPDCNTNNIYITSDQDLIMSYCKSGGGEDLPGVANQSSINISNILTGKLLWKIHADAGIPPSIADEEDDDRSRARVRLAGRPHQILADPSWVPALAPSSGNMSALPSSSAGPSQPITPSIGAPFPFDPAQQKHWDTGRRRSTPKPPAKSRLHLSSTTVAEALEEITSIFYDEERNEIYSGNKLGFVHVWGH